MDFSFIADKVKAIFSEPSKLFLKVKRDKGIKDAFIYFAVISAIFVFGSFAVSLFSRIVLKYATTPYTLSQLNLPTSMIILVLALTYLFSYAFGLGAIFVGAGIFHVWLMIFGAKHKYYDTFKIAVYSGTPYYLLGWIPIIGWLSAIYTLILQVIGVEKIAGFSRGKSILVVLLPLVIIFALSVFIAVIALLLFGAAFYTFAAL